VFTEAKPSLFQARFTVKSKPGRGESYSVVTNNRAHRSLDDIGREILPSVAINACLGSQGIAV